MAESDPTIATFQWMWADAGIQAITTFGSFLTKANPIRWSKTLTAEDIIINLEHTISSNERNKTRPIILRCTYLCPTTGRKEQQEDERFDNYMEAIEYIQQIEEAKAGENQKIELASDGDTLALGATFYAAKTLAVPRLAAFCRINVDSRKGWMDKNTYKAFGYARSTIACVNAVGAEQKEILRQNIQAGKTPSGANHLKSYRNHSEIVLDSWESFYLPDRKNKSAFYYVDFIAKGCPLPEDAGLKIVSRIVSKESGIWKNLPGCGTLTGNSSGNTNTNDGKKNDNIPNRPIYLEIGNKPRRILKRKSQTAQSQQTAPQKRDEEEGPIVFDESTFEVVEWDSDEDEIVTGAVGEGHIPDPTTKNSTNNTQTIDCYRLLKSWKSCKSPRLTNTDHSEILNNPYWSVYEKCPDNNDNATTTDGDNTTNNSICELVVAFRGASAGKVDNRDHYGSPARAFVKIDDPGAPKAVKDLAELLYRIATESMISTNASGHRGAKIASTNTTPSITLSGYSQGAIPCVVTYLLLKEKLEKLQGVMLDLDCITYNPATMFWPSYLYDPVKAKKIRETKGGQNEEQNHALDMLLPPNWWFEIEDKTPTIAARLMKQASPYRIRNYLIRNDPLSESVPADRMIAPRFPGETFVLPQRSVNIMDNHKLVWFTVKQN